MLFIIPPRFYVILFILVLLCVPAVLCAPFEAFQEIKAIYCGLMLANALGLAFVWFFNSGPLLSFPKGLEIIASANISGCANLTMLYLFPVLFIVYCIAFYNAVVGLKKGKRYTERKWVEEVNKYEALRQRRS
jgi:ABC-type branched-subunit amino acid transport system permease subunit